MRSEAVTFRDYGNAETAASDIALLFHEWNSYRDVQLTRWEEIDRYIHATDTKDMQDHFNHKTHIPVVSQIHEDLQAILYGTVFPHNDWLGWQPFDMDAASMDKRKKVLGYLKHAHGLNYFKNTVRGLLDDYTRYGNCFAQVCYTSESKEEEDGTVTPGYAGPALKRISPYDIVFDPTAATFEATPKIVQEIQTKGGFISFVDNLRSQGIEISDEAVKYVLEKSTGRGQQDTSTTRKNAQYQQMTSIESFQRTSSVRLLWFYGSIFDNDQQELHSNRLIVTVDEKFTLFDIQENDPMIFKAGWKKRPDNLWSQGALDNIVGINYMVNHRENAKNDAIDRYIYPDRLYQGEVEEIYDENTSQIKYLTTEGGAVTDITPDSTVLSFNPEIEMHEQRARLAARLPQQLSGFRSPGEKTATEVQTLNDGAFRGFINKAEQFEQDFLEKIVTAEITIARKNYSSVINVMQEDQEGFFSLLEVTEEDLKSNGKLIPFGARRFARMLQQQQGLQTVFSSPLAQYIQPHLNTYGLTEVVNKVFGFDEFEMFSKFASVEEQLDQQKAANVAQQELVRSTDQLTPEELEGEF